MAYELGILLGDQDNPFWQEQILWYRRYLPESPFHAQIFFPEDALDPAAQADLCKTLLRKGFDALLVNPLDETAVAQAAAASRSRTVVFDLGPMSDPKLARSLSKYQPLSLCDYQEQGKACTQELLRHARKLRRFCCIGGPQRARQSRSRVVGALAALSGFPGVEKRTVWSDFTREGGQKAMFHVLEWQPDAVFCANDLMALGALDVLHSHGIAVPVGGADRIPSAEFAVGTGDMTATVGPRGDDVAPGVIHAMDDFLTAGAVSSGFLAENHVVTRESLRRERRGRRHYTPYP
ncbi:substrate-binding domain-containing protein [Pyramidobacter piscolens]|uniref:substrate-binding domain-containing protein n=1 Tax=Pyramidobacter piscolens TaxID=638849 RepID=UPI003AB85DB2